MKKKNHNVKLPTAQFHRVTKKRNSYSTKYMLDYQYVTITQIIKQRHYLNKEITHKIKET